MPNKELQRTRKPAAELRVTSPCAICYASANIKALETLRYAEHICNYVVILDSWFYGKISQPGSPENLGHDRWASSPQSLSHLCIISLFQKYQNCRVFRCRKDIEFLAIRR